MKIPAKILLIIILTGLVCSISFVTFKRGLKNYNNHSTERLDEMFNKHTRYDMLFIGSSRTHTSINPAIVDSILKLNSYNAGVEGGNLLEFKMTLNAYLYNHPAPQYLVLTLDLGSFNLARPFFNYTKYFDFLDNPVIDTTLSKNGHNTNIYKLIPLISITDYDDYSKGNAIKGLLNRGGKEILNGDYQYKGYLSNTLKGINNTTDIVYKSDVHDIAISDTAKKYLDDIITICRQKRIKIIFTYAPEYNFELQKRVKNSTHFFELVTQTAAKNNIPYFRDDSLSMCSNPKLFANIGHVNTPGALEYSLVLANNIKKLLQK